MSQRCKEYTRLVVDGEIYRAEEYQYRSCSEILIRGTFKRDCFQSNGKPVFKKGIVTAFKLKGFAAMPVDTTKSSKRLKTDPEMLAPWEPFAEAYLAIKLRDWGLHQ